MKYFALFLLLFVSIVAFSQNKRVKVTMKNGTVLVGELKNISVGEYVTLAIAGADTKIPFSEVGSVDDVISSEKTIKAETINETMQFKTFILDNSDYPESFEVEVGGQKFVMRLVRGGEFYMGFDGKHSMAMNSEPVHKVTLSSFYISTDYVKSDVVRRLLYGKECVNNGKYLETGRWSKANQVVSAISAAVDRPYRMLTEAEWEYAALIFMEGDFFSKEKIYEWCSDFYKSEYPNREEKDPVGPSDGSTHVYRSFGSKRGLKDRQKKNDVHNIRVRIAISADKIK